MAVALYKIDATIVTVALPTIQHDLNTTPQTLAWTVSAYILALSSTIPLSGMLGDRFGRRKVFVAGILLFAAASTGCALSPTDEWLIGFRALQGVAAGVLVPLSMGIIGATFRSEDLPTAYGLWSGVSSIGFVVGPLVGGVLVEELGWSSIFWVNVPLSLVLVPMSLALISETRDANPRRPDLIGLALAISGIFAVAWALIGTTTTPWLAAATIVPAAAGVMLLGCFVFWESQCKSPMLPLDFFRAPGFSVGAIVGGIVYAFPAVLILLALYFQGILGNSPATAGLMFLPLALSLTVVAILAGPITRRLGELRSMAIGMCVMTLGAAGLSTLPVSGAPVTLALSEVVFGVGIMLTIPAASSVMMGAVPRERAGIASSVMQSFRQVGAVLFVAVLSAVAAAKTTATFAQPAEGLRTIQAVVGAGITAVQDSAGRVAAEMAASAWTSGMQLAFVCVAVVAFAGFLLCIVSGGRRYRASRHEAVVASQI